MDNLKLEQLEEKILEELGMELMDDRITSVKETIESWEKAIENKEESIMYNLESNLKIIEELKNYEIYDCMYAIDSKYGGCWGQGFIITLDDFNFIGFVRTI